MDLNPHKANEQKIHEFIKLFNKTIRVREKRKEIAKHNIQNAFGNVIKIYITYFFNWVGCINLKHIVASMKICYLNHLCVM